jgi:DNA-binding MarR family transcriptional regulator
MNQIVAGLETRHIVQRAAHPTHGRILPTSLTQQGRHLVAQAHQRVGAVEARMTAGLSHDERHQLTRMLDACATALTPTHTRH